jgi:hypothetical protein
MYKKNKKLALKLSVCIFILIGINLMSFGLIMGNFGDCGFDSGGGKDISIVKDVSIKLYITEGAGYFLNSNSGMQLFLNKIEMSELNGVDYKELRDILYRTIENMEKAKEAYYNLKQKADNTPYNQAFINQLLFFDYAGFQNEKGLNETILKYVESFLREGDMRGFFAILLANSDKILNKLYTVKESVDSDRFPEISTIWRLSQDYSETILFGQYGSEVFYKIIGATKNVCE